jgi:hypothetical protein
MDFTSIDFADFKQAIQELKNEIDAEVKQNPNIDDESIILMDAINSILHELKDTDVDYANFDLAKKKRLLPNLSLVFLMTKSYLNDEEYMFDDDEDWEFEEEGCEEEGGACHELPQVKSTGCCGGGGHSHHHHKHH